MKSFVLAMALVLSSSVFAQTATEAVSQLISSGVYEGKNGREKCKVTILNSADAVTVAIENKNNQNDAFSLLNSQTNFSVKETGEISALVKLNYPHYLQGGSKILNVKPNDLYEVEFYISTILLDHRGNDASTFVACKVAL